MSSKLFPNKSASESSISVSDLAALSDQCRATGRIRRESQHQAEGSIGQSTYQILNKTLVSKLSNLELLGDTSRNSVIKFTTSRTRITSTPSSSPPPQEPPRQCQSVSNDLISAFDVHNSTCSEISSIGANDVFEPMNVNSSDLPTAVIQPVTSMDAAEKLIKSKVRKLDIKMRGYTLSQLSSGTLAWHKSYIDEVRNVYEDMLEAIEVFLEDFIVDLSEEKVVHWNNQKGVLAQTFQAYIANFSSKLESLQQPIQQPPLHPTATSYENFQLQQLQLLKEQNEIAQNKVTSAANETLKELEAKKNSAIKKAQAKRENILQLIEDLNERIGDVEDWKEESDLSISRGLRNLSSWRKDLDKINSMFMDFTELYSANDLTEADVEMGSTQLMVNKIVKEIRDIGKTLEEEDISRELYTLDVAITDKVKLPTFEGKDEEDYARFKFEVEKGFVHNRVTRADKLLKLRECLRGHARKLIPDSLIQDIDDAWTVLDKAFGDPVRLLKSKTDALHKMESLPRENGKRGLKGQVEWYIELESLMQNLLAHGKSSEKLGMIVFQPLFINDIYNLFPSPIANKLLKCEGETQVLFENVLQKISQLRAEAQKLQIAREAKKPVGELRKEDSSKKQSHFGYGKSSKGVKHRSPDSNMSSSLVTYNPPIRDENCRVCNTLEATGDTKELYDSHFSNYPTGCPRYIAMSVNKRYQIAIEAKLCLSCHHPDYIYRKNDKSHNCSVVSAKRKGRYTCQYSNCFMHIWVCTRHKSSNIKFLEKFEEEVKSKFGLDFGFVVNVPVFASQISSKNKRKTSVTDISSSLHDEVAVKTTGQGDNKPSVSSDCSQIIASPDKSSNINNGEQSNQSSAAACSHKRRKTLSTDQAIVKLKKKLTAQGVNDQLQPIASGSAQFMIGYSKCKSRDLMTLYDTGCSSVLFRDGVPQQELQGSVLKTKGPFTVKGVGDTAVTVMDEYLCAMELTDNRRQIMEGWTVSKITATLPLVNLTFAEAELKSSLNNTELDQLHCYPQAGGECDVLLGIMYASIFPVPVHSLPNGLTIYRLNLKSHDSRYNAVIGGPHATFHLMTQEFGSLGIMFANLTQQLATYQEFGPPKISRNLMSKEDLDFARKYNEWGVEDLDDTILDFECISSFEPGNTDDPNFKVLACSDCGEELSLEAAASLGLVANAAAIECDVENSTVKNLQKAVNEGLNIDYRCPRCRNCHDCRRSFETERVSLREEAEDMLIWDSVVIDWKNKQLYVIYCSEVLKKNSYQITETWL